MVFTPESTEHGVIMALVGSNGFLIQSALAKAGWGELKYGSSYNTVVIGFKLQFLPHP